MRLKANKIDEYRVNLFKKKLRSFLETIFERPRFEWSHGRTHIIFDNTRYSPSQESGEIAIDILTRNNIEFIILPGFLDEYFGKKTIGGISIPIDQEALPERVRPQKKPKRIKNEKRSKLSRGEGPSVLLP